MRSARDDDDDYGAAASHSCRVAGDSASLACCRRLRAWQPTWRRRQSERHGPSDSTFTISPRPRGRGASAPPHRALPSGLGLAGRKDARDLERQKLPAKVQKQLPTLCEGALVDRGDNLLAFGLPGRGKSHLVCAIGHELVRRGRRVLFTPTYALVQRLLAAKRDLRLEKEPRDPGRLRRRHPRRHRLHPAGPGGDGGPLHVPPSATSARPSSSRATSSSASGTASSRTR
ncbi:MAG: ATP-binding protein [Polyangiaceae bacterium]|nr:ATP-binding protein [Polyangiaceae bacterium]